MLSPAPFQAFFWVTCALLALLLIVGAMLWRNQRSLLHRARADAAAARAQLQSVRGHHALLSTAVRQSPLVPYRCEAQVGGAVLFIGEAIEALTGWQAEAFTAHGKRIEDVVHPDDLRRLRARLARALDRGQDIRFECRVLHRDGRQSWVSGHGELHRGAGGLALVEGAFLKVDERKALEQLLRERERLYSSLIANIPGVAYRCTPDENWRVIFISDVVERLAGWTPAHYHASPTLLRELVHVDDHQRVHAQIQQAIAQNRGFTLEYRAVHRDGRIFWAWEQGRAVRGDAGDVLWLDGVIMDISERKAMETALREAAQSAHAAAAAKTDFLANMGHEVRTPLNAIIGFSEMVLKTTLDGLQREHVYKVRQSARALLRLINDILDMAKLERGTLVLAAADFSLFELVHEAVQAQRAAADKKALTLQLDIDPGVDELFHGDAPRLRQALDKLLDNAVKFTDRGTVRLQLGIDAGRLLLAVHDTGIGIAPDRQERIFEAFTQADPSMSRRYGGTGLGATLAHRLVERMGGLITVHSAPGSGSSFCVRLPMTRGHAEAAAPAVASIGAVPVSSGGRHRVEVRENAAGAGALEAAQAAQAAQVAGAAQAAEAACAVDQAGQAACPTRAEPTAEAVRQAIDALRSGDRADGTLPQLLVHLRQTGLLRQAAQLEHALALFDLDRAAEVLETLPSML